ncbi:MAG TPA: hypothetical protein VEA38_09420 [Terriglobales bacterium]|nr:hypothetical protein [Terriglobales bacterium]
MPEHDYPIITRHLVPPSLRTCQHGTHQYPALIFAEHGPLVLFAAEYARRFGVGFLAEDGRVVDADQFPSLDDAARMFLSKLG